MAATVGFVLGGGGNLGAHEVGMLRALLEQGIRPDLVVGTSVGALNGAAVAADPSVAMLERLEATWLRVGRDGIFDSPLRVATTVLRERTHLHSNAPLVRLIRELLPETFEELQVRFQCVAASIEAAAERWFSSGPLLQPILASSAVPGLLPIVQIGGEHFIDGGVVNSIPIERAVTLGATEVYILHVGRIEHPLQPPRSLVQVATVAFEVARRHRFSHDMAHLPEGIVAHVLPTGGDVPHAPLLRSWEADASTIEDRIAQAYRATSAYLHNL